MNPNPALLFFFFAGGQGEPGRPVAGKAVAAAGVAPANGRPQPVREEEEETYTMIKL